MSEAEARGERFPLVAAIGYEPACAYASQLFQPLGSVDELALCGSFKGAPLEIMPCQTIDADAPANCEIVLEMTILPNERRPDGPYGEFHGTYGGSPSVHVAQVTAITMRKDPIYQTVMTGMPPTENQWITGPAREAMAWSNARRTGVEIVDLYITASGAHTNHIVVAIRKRHQEEPRQVIMALLSTGRGVTGFTRVTVVDEDIDPHDMADVDWAIMNRCEPDLDLIIIPGWQDYASARGQHSSGIVRPGVRGAKWGIDATAPLAGRWAYQKVFVPGQGAVDWRKGEQLWVGVDLSRRQGQAVVVAELDRDRDTRSSDQRQPPTKVPSSDETMVR
jgi:2,5-furandicarboxylate decarboxylase 1